MIRHQTGPSIGPALMDGRRPDGINGWIAFNRASESDESAVSLASVGDSWVACISVTLLF